MERIPSTYPDRLRPNGSARRPNRKSRMTELTQSNSRALVPLNDLSRRYPGEAEMLVASVERVVGSGWYVHGPEHAAFEQEFATFLGVDHCVGVASGTDALELSLRALRRAHGTVVTAANAGGYTSIAARAAGLSVRYADVNPDSLCLSAETVFPCLDQSVAAVVVTHLYGLLPDLKVLHGLCRSRGVALIEDCAQATGAKRHGRRAGAFGDMAAFSFYPTKNLGALGDGGAVVTNDASYDSALRALRHYGWGERYVVKLAGGRNSRLDEIQAAVLRERLKFLDAQNSRRRAVVARYVEAAAGTGARVLPATGTEHVAHLAVIVTDKRDHVRHLFSEARVATEVHYPIPDHRQPAFRSEFTGGTLPETEHAAKRVLTLPCFPNLTDEEIDRVCEVLRGL